MPYQTLKISQQPLVQRIQLYRPEADNGLNHTLLTELRTALEEVESNDKIKIVVLEGLPTVFSIGMDFNAIAEQQQLPEADPSFSAQIYYNLLKQITASAKVIISQVRGRVTAGGVGLVAASDLVLADQTTTFTLPELLFGLLPACVLPFLIRRVGYHRAYRLALTTQSLSVQEAHLWGLVDDYGSEPEVLLRKFLQRLRRLKPENVKRLKNYIDQLRLVQPEMQEALAVNTIAELMAKPEVQQGIRGYIQEGTLPWQH
uniref:Enoyl-CoA hydratase/isomerase n=1 Tax=Cyanothece sp. (strain PCC 7425 / ATCC 29141) TaxID=395961 RepID=B8HKZ4_CYAP4